MNLDHSDHNTVKISKKTQKSLEDLRRVALPQISMS